MQRIKRFGLVLVCSGMVLAAGCSSRPDEDQMKQLDNLRQEVASLQRDISSKEQQRGTLDREVADKNAKIQKCNSDQQTVQQRLAK